jgi:hypothetical protein
MQRHAEMDPLLPVMLGFLCLALVVGIAIHVFYLLTLQRALFRVSPWNRLLEPSLVWLGLIPFFNIVWNFYLATRVPDSLRNEVPGKGMGRRQ